MGEHCDTKIKVVTIIIPFMLYFSYAYSKFLAGQGQETLYCGTHTHTHTSGGTTFQASFCLLIHHLFHSAFCLLSLNCLCLASSNERTNKLFMKIQ